VVGSFLRYLDLIYVNIWYSYARGRSWIDPLRLATLSMYMNAIYVRYVVIWLPSSVACPQQLLKGSPLVLIVPYATHIAYETPRATAFRPLAGGLPYSMSLLTAMLAFLFLSTTRVSSLRSSPRTCLLSSTSRHPQHLVVADRRHPLWTHVSVEWSPTVATVSHSLESVATHFIFPDLPQVYTAEHRTSYLSSTPPEKQMPTLAVGRHYDPFSSSSSSSSWQSLVETAKSRLGMSQHDSCSSTDDGGVPPTRRRRATKLLIVGGNDKPNHGGSSTTTTTIVSSSCSSSPWSTEQAVTILRSELDLDHHKVELWAVADPNDPDSPRRVETKIQAGVRGFITQPLLTLTAWETIQSYDMSSKSLVVGMACPRSATNLQFWRTLLTRPELVGNDPLFQDHLHYFSSQRSGQADGRTSSLAWIERELEQVDRMTSQVDGVHFMPLRNVDDLVTIFDSLRTRESQT
jgi:hypothetical protein